LYEAANLFPCWPHAQSQLPIFSPLAQPPPPPFSPLPTHRQTFMATDDINTPESSPHRHSVFHLF
jgi:hypothetical protein